MKCDRCQEAIEKGEEREMHGQCLCEDCYIDALSPAKACDPGRFTAPNPLPGIQEPPPQ